MALRSTMLALIALCLATTANAAGEFDRAWKDPAKSSIILDAYEFTPVDWDEMRKNKRVAAWINKASDGLPPKYCGNSANAHCRTKWRRYAVTKELYHTRKTLAKALGMKWGAYHLARPGNPIQQAQHFLRFAKPDKDDLIALDIEDNDPKKWMSFKDAEIFARYIKKRTGRYPVLYTNHSTAKTIAQNRTKYRLLARLNLWYARYRPEMRGAFPMGNWDSYAMWQFSSMVNCSRRSCPMRIRGVDHKIDVNVAWMPEKELRAAWPFAEITAPETPPAALPVPATKPLLVAKAAPAAKQPVSDAKPTVAFALAAAPKIPAGIRAVMAATKSTSRNDTVRSREDRIARTMWVAKAPLPMFRPGSAFTMMASIIFHDDAVLAAQRANPFQRPEDIWVFSDDVHQASLAALTVPAPVLIRYVRNDVPRAWPVSFASSPFSDEARPL